MLTLAPSEDPFPVSPDEFDADPWLFNTISGTIDLRTGKVSQPCREDLITKLAPVKWSWGGGRQLAGVHQPDFSGQHEPYHVHAAAAGVLFYRLDCATIADFMCRQQRQVNARRCDRIRHGRLRHDRAGRHADGSHRHEPHPTQLADLHGKRFVIATETEDGSAFAESLVSNSPVLGSDRARCMRENFWEFSPCHKIILQTNHRPEDHRDRSRNPQGRFLSFSRSITRSPDKLRDKRFQRSSSGSAGDSAMARHRRFGVAMRGSHNAARGAGRHR